MKTIACFFMAVVAVTAADGGFDQQQSAPSAPNAYANYNNYDYQQPHRQQSLLDRFSNNIRRQGLGGLLGGLGGFGGTGAIGPAVNLIVAAVSMVVIIAGLAYFISEFTSSGRGIDTDAWEINHSVWMDQLQKDFEDSWSVE